MPWKRGDRVRPTDEFWRMFPAEGRNNARRRFKPIVAGTILYRVKDDPDLYFVQWDERLRPTRLHEKFMESVPK